MQDGAVDDLGRSTLVSLYAIYMEAVSAGDAAKAADIVAGIGLRAAQAFAILALIAANMSDDDLNEAMVHLGVAATADSRRAPEIDAATREIVRVQRAAYSAELERRSLLARNIARGGARIPRVMDVVGGLVQLAEYATANPRGADARFIQDIGERCSRALAEAPSGTRSVAAVLRAAASVVPPKGFSFEVPYAIWLAWGVALDALIGGGAFRELTAIPPSSGATAAEAERALRLLYGYDRNGSGDLSECTLILPGDELATLLENAAAARTFWRRSAFPQTDLIAYLSPNRREESGRPEPSNQIVLEAVAHQAAQRAGGVIVPMLYPIAREHRPRITEWLWRNGLPAVPDSELGWPVYGCSGDVRVRWGAPPHPLGLLCAVTIPSANILSIGLDEFSENEAVYAEAILEAERRPVGVPHPLAVRKALLSRGVLAVARYDHWPDRTPSPNELILLDPRPQYVAIIRESVPAFVFVARKASLAPTYAAAS